VTGVGELRGWRPSSGDGLAFLGVPYAQAPVGDLRWAPPRPAEPWTGVRDARAPGPICPQPARPFSIWAHGPLPSADEDSLSLNVWTPPDAGDGAGRPVLVFLHGGGWALGWGSNPLLDGRHLAATLDAIVVTLNYRLGALGWLHHPAFSGHDGAPAGDWGLLDQLAALRWVAEQIVAFGGDPSRVTLAGESVGAGSVLHLLGAPGAEGLFVRVIAQSPTLHELVVDPSLSVGYTETLVAHLGLGDDVGAALPALRALPAQTIVAAQEQLIAGGMHGPRGGALPVVDPAALPADPARVPEIRPEVPMLIGTNADEGTFFFRAANRRQDPDEAELTQLVSRLTHCNDPAARIDLARQRVAASGREPTTNDLLCAVITDAWFTEPVERYSRARARGDGEVHRYRLDQPAAEDDLGAVHTLDVPLLFGSWREGGVAARLAGTGSQTAAVTRAMNGDWRRFVHGQTLDWAPVSGDPDEATSLAVYGGADGPRGVVRSEPTAGP
jgi:para-nitrobenzyl esterase